MIDFAVLGDFAQAVAGKLTVVGAGWNIVNAVQYPMVIPFGLGLGFLVPWHETNRQQQFTFAIRSSEGPELASGSGDFEVGRQTGLPVGMTQRVVVGLAGQIQIPGPGPYEITVSCAGREKQIVFQALPVGLQLR